MCELYLYFRLLSKLANNFLRSCPYLKKRCSQEDNSFDVLVSPCAIRLVRGGCFRSLVYSLLSSANRARSFVPVYELADGCIRLTRMFDANVYDRIYVYS